MSSIAEPYQVTSNLFSTFISFDDSLNYYLSVFYPEGCLCSQHNRICSLIRRSDTRCLFQCSEHRHQFSIFKGTTFEGTKLPLNKLLLVLLCFYIKCRNKQCMMITGVSAKTVSEFYNLCNSAMCSYIIDNLEPIGGPGTIVQIDESILRRRKYQRGRRKPQIWIFGAIEVLSEGRTGRIIITRVPNRTAATLIPIIQHFILPGSTIFSDEWSAYSSLGTLGYQHRTVNHSQHFKDPETGCCTNAIEGLWHQFRQFIPTNGIRERKVDQLIGSFLGHKNLQLQFKQFLHIVATYNPETEPEEEKQLQQEQDIPELGEFFDDDDDFGITDGLEEPEFCPT